MGILAPTHKFPWDEKKVKDDLEAESPKFFGDLIKSLTSMYASIVNAINTLADITDHGALGGLADDDHSHYLKEEAEGGTAAETPNHTHADAGECGQLDHGLALTLVSRNDDDHLLYHTPVRAAIWLAANHETTYNHPQQMVQGWVHFDGTGGCVPDDSFNVASVTDTGVGDYTVVWDTDFANDDYAVLPGGGFIGKAYRFFDTFAIAVGSVGICVYTAAGNASDPNDVMVIAIGDQ